MKLIPGFDDYVFDGKDVYSRKRLGGLRKLAGHQHETPNGVLVVKYQLYQDGKKRSITLDKIKRITDV